MAAGPIRSAHRGIGPPVQDDSARDDAEHAERNAAIEVLLEHEPRQERREHAFQGQQKRRGGCIDANKPDQQQHGTDHAAGQDGRREPGKLTTRQPRLGQGADPPDGQVYRQQADASATIEDAGQHPRVRRIEEDFRHRRREAEQDGRADGDENS
jgi:hypothetical protein